MRGLAVPFLTDILNRGSRLRQRCNRRIDFDISQGHSVVNRMDYTAGSDELTADEVAAFVYQRPVVVGSIAGKVAWEN